MSLKGFREQAGITQAQLAEAAGVSQQLVSHLETGLRRAEELGLDRARALVEAINRAGIDCTLDEVFPRSEQAA